MCFNITASYFLPSGQLNVTLLNSGLLAKLGLASGTLTITAGSLNGITATGEYAISFSYSVTIWNGSTPAPSCWCVLLTYNEQSPNITQELGDTMPDKLKQFYLRSVGVALAVTAVAKLVAAAGSSRYLELPDPILVLKFRDVLLVAGLVEITVVWFCLFGTRIGTRCSLVAWLSTSFILYRIGLSRSGWHKPCACLGNLTDALHVSPGAADIAMKIVLGYMFAGSYAILFLTWLQKRKASSLAQPLSREAGFTTSSM
jgi:hypothetical protein